MGDRRYQGTVIASVAAVSLIAACGTSSGSETDGQVSITYAIAGSAAFEALPGLVAISRVANEHGHNLQVVATPETPLLMEGVSTGEFTFGQGSWAAFSTAVHMGAEMSAIGVEARQNWIMAAAPGMETCADLDGASVGLHSVGSAGEARYFHWASENCTPEEADAVNIQYVSGSANRVQALQTDTLDAAMITIEEFTEVDDEFSIMINFMEETGDQDIGWQLFANDEFIENYPEIVEEFLYEVVKVSREMRDDVELTSELAQEHLDGYSPEAADEAAAIAVEAGLYLEDGGLEALSNVAAAVDFHIETLGDLSPEVRESIDKLTNTAPLEAALARLDG